MLTTNSRLLNCESKDIISVILFFSFFILISLFILLIILKIFSKTKIFLSLGKPLLNYPFLLISMFMIFEISLFEFFFKSYFFFTTYYYSVATYTKTSNIRGIIDSLISNEEYSLEKCMSDEICAKISDDVATFKLRVATIDKIIEIILLILRFFFSTLYIKGDFFYKNELNTVFVVFIHIILFIILIINSIWKEKHWSTDPYLHIAYFIARYMFCCCCIIAFVYPVSFSYFIIWFLLMSSYYYLLCIKYKLNNESNLSLAKLEITFTFWLLFFFIFSEVIYIYIEIYFNLLYALEMDKLNNPFIVRDGLSSYILLNTKVGKLLFALLAMVSGLYLIKYRFLAKLNKLTRIKLNFSNVFRFLLLWFLIKFFYFLIIFIIASAQVSSYIYIVIGLSFIHILILYLWFFHH